MNQQGIERIGEQFGVVQILATGLQSTEGEDHPQKMTLFASRGKDNHLHHYAFWYGSERERQREMLIGTIQECPGMYFNLDCGCSQRRDHVVSSVFHQDADASLLLSFDPETTTPYLFLWREVSLRLWEFEMFNIFKQIQNMDAIFSVD